MDQGQSKTQDQKERKTKRDIGWLAGWLIGLIGIFFRAHVPGPRIDQEKNKHKEKGNVGLVLQKKFHLQDCKGITYKEHVSSRSCHAMPTMPMNEVNELTDEHCVFSF